MSKSVNPFTPCTTTLQLHTQEESAQVASGGLVANPASLVNILSLLRFMEREPGPGLVSGS